MDNFRRITSYSQLSQSIYEVNRTGYYYYFDPDGATNSFQISLSDTVFDQTYPGTFTYTYSNTQNQYEAYAPHIIGSVDIGDIVTIDNVPVRKYELVEWSDGTYTYELVPDSPVYYTKVRLASADGVINFGKGINKNLSVDFLNGSLALYDDDLLDKLNIYVGHAQTLNRFLPANDNYSEQYTEAAVLFNYVDSDGILLEYNIGYPIDFYHVPMDGALCLETSYDYSNREANIKVYKV